MSTSGRLLSIEVGSSGRVIGTLTATPGGGIRMRGDLEEMRGLIEQMQGSLPPVAFLRSLPRRLRTPHMWARINLHPHFTSVLDDSDARLYTADNQTQESDEDRP